MHCHLSNESSKCSATFPMKAENAVLICVHRGTTAELFTALWHLITKSADAYAWWWLRDLYTEIKPEATVTYTMC